MQTRCVAWFVPFLTVGLTMSAAAGEFEVGGEGYAFTLRDTRPSALEDFGLGDDGPTFHLPDPLDLHALGWRARATFTFHDGAARVSAVWQRTRDGVRTTRVTSFVGFDLTQDEDAAATLDAFDARYEHRVAVSGRFELRLQGGYRFARVSETSTLTGTCPVCRALLDARIARLTYASGLSAHGLRVGLASDVRLAGPLHLESEAGLALLAATQKYTGESFYSGLELSSRIFEAASRGRVRVGPIVEARARGSLATWDLAARLRVEWKGVSAGVGYRFERWSEVPGPLLASDLGFDGLTFGLGWRFGL